LSCASCIFVLSSLVILLVGIIPREMKETSNKRTLFFLYTVSSKRRKVQDERSVFLVEGGDGDAEVVDVGAVGEAEGGLDFVGPEVRA